MTEVVHVRDGRELAALMRQRQADLMHAVTAAIIEAAYVGQRVLRSRVPVDTGELRRETNVRETGLEVGVVAEIVEATPYAAAMEAGTRPFWPPIAPLIEWAKRQAPNLGIDEDEAVGFAYAVQKSIARHGIRAKWHTRDAIPDLGRILERFLRLAVQRVRPAAAR